MDKTCLAFRHQGRDPNEGASKRVTFHLDAMRLLNSCEPHSCFVVQKDNSPQAQIRLNPHEDKVRCHLASWHTTMKGVSFPFATR